MIKLSELLKESILEMGLGDWGVKNVVQAYNSDANKAKEISIAFTNNPNSSLDDVLKFIGAMEKEDFDQTLQSLGLYDLEEKEKPGLWANIRAQRARGEKPARKGSEAFKKAVKAAKEINKKTK